MLYSSVLMCCKLQEIKTSNVLTVTLKHYLSVKSTHLFLLSLLCNHHEIK